MGKFPATGTLPTAKMDAINSSLDRKGALQHTSFPGGQTPTHRNVALSTHFFLPPAPPPSSLRSHEMTLPSINAVAVHEGNAGEALAILEGVAHQGLLRLEAALSHLVGLQRVWVLHLLAAVSLPPM